MSGLIEISDFIEHLKANNLIIVDRTEFQRNIENDQDRARRILLSKESAPLLQIAKTGVLQITSKQALRKWIENGTIGPNEWFKDNNGVIRVYISAVKRLQKTKDLY